MSPAASWTWLIGHPPDRPLAEWNELSGGKGAVLSRLARLGLPVPPGFTVSTAACRAYWQSDQQLPAGLWEEIESRVAQLEVTTGTRFGHADRPLLLAVRSGAKQAMPGILATLLNCGLTRSLVESSGRQSCLAEWFSRLIVDFARVGHGIDVSDSNAAGESHWPDLLDDYQRRVGKEFPDDPWLQLQLAVRWVFDSWNSPRAVQYRALRGIRDHMGTAINIQAMVPVQQSGLLLSQDPIGHEQNTTVIEVVAGLGDRLAAGQQTPCRFLVRGQRVCERNDAEVEPGVQLADEKLLELAASGRELEREFGCPVEVEWGMHDGHLVLFQVRPQSASSIAADQDACVAREWDRLQETIGEGRVWVRHNLAEAVPAPTPLTWDILRRYMSGKGGFGQLYRQLGYAPSKRVCRCGFLELWFGQIYADPRRMVEMFYPGLPLAYDLDRVKQDPSLLDRAPEKVDPEATDAGLLLRLPHMLWVLLRAARRARRLQLTARQQFEERVVPEFEAYLAGERAIDAGTADADQLLERLQHRTATVLDRFAPDFLKPGVLGGLALARLEAEFVRFFGQSRGERRLRTLIQALDADWRCGPDAWLRQATDPTLPQLLARFGHRAAGEWELAQPRWREQPATPQQLLRTRRLELGNGPPLAREEARRRRERAEKRLPQMLAACGASSTLQQVQRDLATVRTLLPYREIGKHYLMMGYDLIRQTVEALADRLDLGSDIYFLTMQELRQYVAGERLATQGQVTTQVGQRRFHWQMLTRVALPDVVDGEAIDRILNDVPLAAGDQWIEATSLSNGVARGPVRMVAERTPMVDPARTGYVLVCETLDPSLTPLMAGACALVVRRGGMLSHGAAVARQMGLPAVACPRLPVSINDANWLIVDGSRGRVRLERGM